MALNQGQQSALDAVMNGRDILLTGGAGVGKSFALGSIMQALEDDGRSVLACAPTGIAALNIGGTTINAAFLLDFDPKVADRLERVGLSRYVAMADTVVIDEVSMVRRDTMDAIVREVMQSRVRRNGLPHLVLSGDFGQLPPVVTRQDRTVLESVWGRGFSPYAFASDGWKLLDLEPHVLTEQMRQSADVGLNRALDAARLGDPSCLPYFSRLVGPPGEDAVRIMGRNAQVDAENARRLKGIGGESRTYRGSVSGAFARSAMPSPVALDLKCGARVMFTANDRKGHQWVNGECGQVVDMAPGYVGVEKDDGDFVAVTPNVWESARYGIEPNPKTGGKHLAKARGGTYQQMPLRLAYAMTFHKSQGQTLDSVWVEPASFSPGQLYVGLSRVRDSSDLALSRPLTPRDLWADPSVIAFCRSIGMTSGGSGHGRPLADEPAAPAPGPVPSPEPR